MESMDGEDQEYTPEFTPSPMLIPPFPPSQHSDKVFLEKDSGFRSTSHKKLTTKFPGNQIQPDLQKPTKTPLDLALESQKVFRSIGIFCHGFLAGLAFWQLIMVCQKRSDKEKVTRTVLVFSGFHTFRRSHRREELH